MTPEAQELLNAFTLGQDSAVRLKAMVEETNKSLADLKERFFNEALIPACDAYTVIFNGAIFIKLTVSSSGMDISHHMRVDPRQIGLPSQEALQPILLGRYYSPKEILIQKSSERKAGSFPPTYSVVRPDFLPIHELNDKPNTT